MPELLLLDDGRIMGGGQRFALRLAAALPGERPGWALTFACPGGSELAEEARGEGLRVVEIPFPDPAPRALMRWPRSVARLRSLVRASPRGTIVLANAVRASAAAILAGAGRRDSLVHVLHERESAERMSVRRVLPRFGAALAVGSETAAAYRSSLGERARVVQANNFLLEPELERLARIRGDGPTAERPVIGVLARLIPEKGVLELVDELAEVRDAWSRLIVAGAAQDEAYASAVRARVRASGLSGSVELLGHVDDVADVLRRVNVLVVPSVGGEAQPTSILEALAAGRPAIVREHIWSVDFADFPVFRYRDADQLGARLGAGSAPPDLARLAGRFGAAQLLQAIERVAARAS